MKNILKLGNYELLSQKAYRVLKRAIIRGDLTPNSKLILTEIAKSLRISITPIREAISKLASEGLVTIIPNKGMIVKEIDIDDFQESLQVRAFLDGLIAKLATEKITNKEIDDMMEMMHEMEQRVKEDDRLTYNDLDIKFHDFLLTIAGNKALKEIYNNLIEHGYRFRLRTLKISDRMGKSLKEHREIALKIKERNSDEANRVSQKHIESILRSLERDEKKKSK